MTRFLLSIPGAAALALVLVALGSTLQAGSSEDVRASWGATPPGTGSAPGDLGGDGSPVVRLVDDPARRHLVLTFGPVSMAPGGDAHQHVESGPDGHSLPHHAPGSGTESEELQPVATITPRTVVVPRSGVLHGVTMEIVDGEGRTLPQSVLHHVNVIRPGRRELFLPVAQRLFAAGKETGDIRFPPLLAGFSVEEGEPWEVLAMLHNPTDRPLEGVEVRLRFQYREPRSVFPLLELHPFHLDVAFPAGEKSFDLPPGTHAWSWEGSPAVGGRVLGMSAHLHENALWIQLEDATAGKVLWEGRPVMGADGGVAAVSVGSFLLRRGLRLRADRRYRVTVMYENRTDRVVPRGGMGVVGGVLVIPRRVRWPSADPADPLFRVDREQYHRALQDPWEVLVETGRAPAAAGAGRGGAWRSSAQGFAPERR